MGVSESSTMLTTLLNVIMPTRLLKGFHQQPVIDYIDTFSSVVKPVTIRTTLSLPFNQGWFICRLDVKNSFLHDFLKELYSVHATTTWFTHPQLPSHVCHLHKALYGLKEAPRAWFAHLTTRLLDFGFSSSKYDSSMFILRTPRPTCYILIYVVDIIITCLDPTTIGSFIRQLDTEFAVKYLGNLHYLLGVEILPVQGGLLLSQQRYISDLLRKVHMVDARSVPSLMSFAHSLSQFVGDAFFDSTFTKALLEPFNISHSLDQISPLL